MNIMEYFQSPVSIRLGVSLAHFLWQGLLIALVAQSLVFLLVKNSSRIRYGLYMTSLIVMVLALGITYSIINVPPSSKLPESVTKNINGETPLSVLETEYAFPTGSETIESPVSESIRTIDETSPPTENKESPQPWNWKQVVPYATGFYFIGVILMLGRLLLGLQGGQRLRKFSKPVEDTGILSALSRQAGALGLSITPAIACCKRIMVPTVVGVLKPTILVPFAFTSGLNFEQVEMLLAHELAHIRRYDPLFNVIQRMIEALLFFHPAVWFLSRKIRIERENCCDDLVLKAGGAATAYASSLLEVAQKTLLAASQRTLSVEGVAAVEKPSQLRSRIVRILGSNSNPHIRLKRPWILLTVLILISIFAITSSIPKGISEEPRPSENQVQSDQESIQVSPSRTERVEEDANRLEITLVEGFRANREKLTSCVLSWTKRTKENGFVRKDRKLEYGGTYELWWAGKKIATKYTEDRVNVYGENSPARLEKYEGGISYDGNVSSLKPEFASDTNWFEIIQWSGKLPLDKRITFFTKKKNVISTWSVTETEGTQKIKHLVKMIDDSDYGIEYYDPVKGYNLVTAESYSGNELYSKRTVKLKQVTGGVWFPIEVEERAIDPKLKKDELHHHFVLDLEQCSFNDPKAIPEGVFESPVKEKQKELDRILEKFKPDTPSRTDTNDVQLAREAAENFIAAVLAGQKEKAVSFTGPRARGDVDDSCEALQGQNVVIEAVFADREAALAISSVILGDHERVGPLSFKIEKVNDDWLINDIDLETTEDTEREIDKFLKKHPQARENKEAVNEKGKTQSLELLLLHLVDPDGHPVEGAKVGTSARTRDKRILNSRLYWGLRNHKKTITNERGEIVLTRPNLFLEHWPPERKTVLYILHEERMLGAFCEIGRNDTQSEMTLTLKPVCHVQGKLTSTFLKKIDRPLKWTNVYLKWTPDSFGILSDNTDDHKFDFFVPVGRYQLSAYGSGEGASTKHIHPEIEVKPGQTELDLGVIDLPPTKVTALIGKSAPELGPIQAWKNGDPVKLSDLRGKVVILHFGGGYPSASRDLPRLVELHKQFSRFGLVIIALYNCSSMQELETRFIERVKKFGGVNVTDIPFRLAVDGGKPTLYERTNRKRLGATYGIYDITMYSTTVLIDQKGKVLGRFPVSRAKGELQKMLSVSPEELETVSWRKRFYEVYRLEEDQIIKRIAPPFIPERKNYYDEEHTSQAQAVPEPPDFFIFHWDGKLNKWGLGFTGGKGRTLKTVLDEINISNYEVEGPDEFLTYRMSGDWIIRNQAPMQDKINALVKLLADEFNKTIRFEKHTVEREVIVARGKFHFHRPSGTFNDEHFHFYSDTLDEDEGAGGGGADSISEFLHTLGWLTEHRVINETQPPQEIIIPYFHHRSAYIYKVKDEAKRAEKLKLLLANISQQTELQFSLETRPVEIWFISEQN